MFAACERLGGWDDKNECGEVPHRQPQRPLQEHLIDRYVLLFVFCLIGNVCFALTAIKYVIGHTRELTDVIMQGGQLLYRGCTSDWNMKFRRFVYQLIHAPNKSNVLNFRVYACICMSCRFDTVHSHSDARSVLFVKVAPSEVNVLSLSQPG